MDYALQGKNKRNGQQQILRCNMSMLFFKGCSLDLLDKSIMYSDTSANEDNSFRNHIH